MAIKYSKLDHTKIQPKDIDAINKLLKQMSPDVQPINASKIENMISTYNALIHMAVDEETAEIIGIATLLHNEKFVAKFGTIEDVVVDERYRGQGIGKRLTEILIENGKVIGLSRIELSSRPHRIAANALYKKLGFEPRDTNIYRLNLK